MTIQEQLIDDIKQLPDDILQDLSGIVKKFLALNKIVIQTSGNLERNENRQPGFIVGFPLYGCAKGKVWMSEDFDAPMEELEDYSG